jgi:hypothetical protein
MDTKTVRLVFRPPPPPDSRKRVLPPAPSTDHVPTIIPPRGDL